MTSSTHVIPPRPADASASDQDGGTLSHAHQLYLSGQHIQALQASGLVLARNPSRTDALLLMAACQYQLRNYHECVTLNDRAIMLSPQMPEAYTNLANALLQLGHVDLAILYYRTAIRLRPAFPDAYNNLASALLQRGMVGEAFECYNTALRVSPNLVDVRTNLGDLWRLQGPLGRQVAERCYTDAITLDPKFGPAWRGLGDLMREAGNPQGAIRCYQNATRVAPALVEAYAGMGRALKDVSQPAEAEKWLEAAVRVSPACSLSIGNLAGLYYENGKYDLAVHYYQQAIKIEPNFPEAYNNMGNALRELGRHSEALACYTGCIHLQYARMQPALGDQQAMAQHVSRLAVAYNNMGALLKLRGSVAEAVACYQRIVQLDPQSPEAWCNLGASCKDMAMHDEAVAAYRQALTLRRDFPEAFANMVHSMQCVCDWSDHEGSFVRLSQVVWADLQRGALPAVQPFHAMAYPFAADLALAISKAYARFCENNAAQLGVPALPHPPALPLAPGQRLRVGYVSSDFGNHPLSHLMCSVFGMHDRSRVEVFLYALSPSDNSVWRQRIEREAEHFIDVSSWSVPDIARRISNDGIQVCVNLNGYTKGARNEIFALRPAPVQASYMGFPATTGAEFLPYLIVDKVVAPPELHRCYSERLALMSHCYFVNDYRQSHMDVLDDASLPTRASVGLPEGVIVYACSNQLYKYDPRTFDCWMDILRAVPNSVLWLLRFPPAGEPRVRHEASRRGVDPSRIIFTDVAQKDVHIKRSALADVFLDTPLCNAHTTGCDVLWAGCPMVTLPLERMASRVAASLCYAVGCPEMVVSSHEEYKDLAIQLGVDHGRRPALRDKLRRNRLNCPLFDTASWVRELECVFFGMWKIHCEGRGPRTFETGWRVQMPN